MKISEISEKLKKIKLKDLFYPAITSFLILTMIFLFVWSVRFLYKSINQIFTSPKEVVESQIPRFNIGQFKKVAPKLGIEVREPKVPEIETSVPEEIKPEATVKEEKTALDKKTLLIKVLNGSGRKGAAADMKKFLEKNEFLVKEIGNAPAIISSTVVKIKDSKKEYLNLIQEAAKNDYSLLTSETLPEAEAFDAIIVVGKK